MNPTFPNKTENEVAIIFLEVFRRKTKEATTPNVYKPLKFSLFDFLGIDEVYY